MLAPTKLAPSGTRRGRHRGNLAYRWFCRLSIEDRIPDHSSAEKSRHRNIERIGLGTEEIRKASGRADAIAADLATPDGSHKLARDVRSIVGDRLDILVANAGASKAASIEETTVDDFDRLFAVNVRAPFFLVQQLLPIMREGSSIVLVSSLAARAVVGTIPAYAATKGAIDTMVKHFAALLGQRGIRVNAVAPGVVATEMSSFTKTDSGRDYALSLQNMTILPD